MNIFYDAPEFITKDNRRLRPEYTTSFESIFHKLRAQLPEQLIQNKTILDLGSCLGAAGYYVLKLGSKHYTGVELQKFYANTSVSLLNKYCDPTKFNIHTTDILTFLDDCITKEIKFDITLASGILYEFMDPISFLQKVCKVTNETVVIDTKWLKPSDSGAGLVVLRPNEAMVRGINSDTHSVVRGIGAMMCSNAIDMVMRTEAYTRQNNVIMPQPITDADDPYNTQVIHPNGNLGPKKIILQYTKDKHYTKTLNDILIEEENNGNL